MEAEGDLRALGQEGLERGRQVPGEELIGAVGADLDGINLHAHQSAERLDDEGFDGLRIANGFVGAGLGPFKGKAIRIGLMGSSSSQRNVTLVLAALESILQRSGAVAAATQVYAGSAA